MRDSVCPGRDPARLLSDLIQDEDHWGMDKHGRTYNAKRHLKSMYVRASISCSTRAEFLGV